MRESLAPTILAFLASGCFYTYNYDGADGGTTGATTSSGSGGTTTGSTGGAGSSSGGTGTTGGSSGAAQCGVPDAGWPIHCSASDVRVFESSLLPTDNALWGLSAVPYGDGGYLLAIFLDSSGDVQFVAVAADGSVSDAGSRSCPSGDCPVSSGVLVPQPGAPPMLVAGYQDPNTTGPTDKFACWSTYDGASAAVIVDLGTLNGGAGVEVDDVQAAVSNGRIGVAVMDYTSSQDALAIGPPGGGCPASATLLHSGEPLGIAIAASGQPATPFVTAETLAGPDQLRLSLVPGDAGMTVDYGATGTSNVYWPAVAADGEGFSALAVSDDEGVQLFGGTLPGFSLTFDGGSVSPPPSFGVSATSCGSGCALIGWVQGSDAGLETPTFAFSTPSGCRTTVAMSPITDDPQRNALTAVAYQPGSALIAYASSFLEAGPGAVGGRVNVRLCGP